MFLAKTLRLRGAWGGGFEETTLLENEGVQPCTMDAAIFEAWVAVVGKGILANGNAMACVWLGAPRLHRWGRAIASPNRHMWGANGEGVLGLGGAWGGGFEEATPLENEGVQPLHPGPSHFLGLVAVVGEGIFANGKPHGLGMWLGAPSLHGWSKKWRHCSQAHQYKHVRRKCRTAPWPWMFATKTLRLGGAWGGGFEETTPLENEGATLIAPWTQVLVAVVGKGTYANGKPHGLGMWLGAPSLHGWGGKWRYCTQPRPMTTCELWISRLKRQTRQCPQARCKCRGTKPRP